MNFWLCFATLLAVCCSVESKFSPAKIQVYSRDPGEFGKDNILICHVSGFHPPNIDIQLMKNGEEIPNAKQTDLAFKADWHFHLTKHVAFNPLSGDKYTCKVTHGDSASKDIVWESNM